MSHSEDSNPILSAEDKEILDSLYDIPIVEKPLSEISNSISKSPAEVLEIISSLTDRKIIRRIAPVYAHRKVGFSNNAMLLIDCKGDDLINLANTISTIK